MKINKDKYIDDIRDYLWNQVMGQIHWEIWECIWRQKSCTVAGKVWRQLYENN